MPAPDRIRVAQDAEGFWTCREAISGSQEYVRADIVADLIAAVVAGKREMWLAARAQWTLADFSNWAVIQQMNAALTRADGTPRPGTDDSPRAPDPVREKLVEALRTKRDYVADAASGALTYEGSGEGFKAMALEDLASIDGALAAAEGRSS